MGEQEYAITIFVTWDEMHDLAEGFKIRKLKRRLRAAAGARRKWDQPCPCGMQEYGCGPCFDAGKSNAVVDDLTRQSVATFVKNQR